MSEPTARELLNLIGAVLLGIFLGQRLEAGPKSPKPGEPKFTVSPRSMLAPLGRGAVIHVRVEITTPTSEMFCPSVELTVYGAPICDAELSASGRNACDETTLDVPAYYEKTESDCDPWRTFEEIVVEPDGGYRIPPTIELPFSWQKAVRVGRGEWTFEVRIQQGAKRVTLRDRALVR